MRNIFFILYLLFAYTTFSQQEDAWLFLKDKPNSAAFISNPLTMLSQRAIDRRTKQNITLDEKDVPIHQIYLNEIKNTAGITVLGKSKWMNAIHIQATKTIIENLFSSVSFISEVEYADKSINDLVQKTSLKTKGTHQNKWLETNTDFTYGNTKNQVEMLKADFLHEQNFTGEGIQIAIIDAGFPNVNTLSAFQRLRDNNQILGGYNFADRNTNFYSRSNHGTHVLSTIAGYVEHQFVGSATDAKFYLFISEIAETETVLEETLWVEAAERADSLGVDVVNTSLGYTTYDNENHSHSYADMNGQTTFVSRGAEIGASRGIIFVNSAGNSGSRVWKYMGAPSDASSVFSVGSVTSTRNISSFSSFGPTSDNRIKPDVLAQGSATAIINFSSGNISTSNGTSFSSPVMAGVVACFWQAFPNKTSFEIMDIIRKSADKYTNPTNQEGFGIPNFERAYKTTLSIENLKNDLDIVIYPNPITFNFNIDGISDDLKNYQLQVLDVLGKQVFQQNQILSKEIDISSLENGMYFLRISKENKQQTIKIIKN